MCIRDRLTGVPIMVLAEIAAAPVFAAACVWLVSRDGVLSPVGKKVLAGSALFYLLFIAVYYDLEVNLILSGLSTLCLLYTSGRYRGIHHPARGRQIWR